MTENSQTPDRQGTDTAPVPARVRIMLVSVIAGALILAAVLGLLAAEAILRLQFATGLYEHARRHPPHPFLQLLAFSEVDHVNSSGFRGEPVETKAPPNVYRIFTIGGSTTLGVANTYCETYPFKLQALLQKRYPSVRIEVQNAAVPWYATPHMLINYQLRVRQYKPDLIITMEAINDLYRSFSPSWWAYGDFKYDYSHYLGPYIRFLGPRVEALSQADRWNWLVWRTIKQNILGEPTPYDYREDNVSKLTARLQPRAVTAFRSLDSYRDFYSQLIKVVQQDHHPVIIASQPSLYAPDLTPADRRLLYFPQIFCAEKGYYPDLASMTAGMKQFNEEARAIAGTAQAGFIDFASAVPKTGAYFSDDVHLRESGNEILARMAYESIVGRHLIEPSEKLSGK